jgi:DNA integrity scanning protein DisA with diadenylate cyclase activity/mannitol/fructose-specific phosphotransferase system IIA component (Ntr-type)
VSSLSLAAGDQEDVIRHLSERAAELCTEISAAEIERLAHDREEIISSVVAERIAFPHAVKTGVTDYVAVIGVLPEDLIWDVPGRPVRVVALFAGGDAEHLQSMSLVARVLRTEGVFDAVISAADDENGEEQILELIVAAADRIGVPGRPDAGDALNQAFVAAAGSIRDAEPESRLVLLGDTFSDLRRVDRLLEQFHGYVLCSRRAAPDTATVAWIERESASFPDLTSLRREMLRMMIGGTFGSARSLIVLSGARRSDRLSSIYHVRRDESRGERLLPEIDASVSGRVLELADELGRQGREGKPVGALFVVGQRGELAAFTHQLIVNPFLGYADEARNILDPSLEETIKEFSKIDGAFIIDVDGTVVSAGTYLAVSPGELAHQYGEGARHASARAITAVTNTVSIAVSESTGRVSVYIGGYRHH